MAGMNTTTLDASRLTAHDRCDRCNAQAYVKYVLTAGGELLFCAHHSRANADALAPLASEVIDETDRLHRRPEPAAD